MGSLFLYLGMLVLGALVGSRKAVRAKPCRWIGPVQSAALIVLILILGVEIGSDQRVFASLSEIGVSALVITLFALAGSIACVFLVRRLLGLDRQGRRRGGEEEDP